MRTRCGGFARSVALLAGIATSVTATAADLRGQAPAVAADPTAASASGWVFGVHSYTWATSVDGTFRTLPPGPAVKLHLGFSDVLDDLDGALMVSAEARRDRLVLFSDLLLSRLSTGRSFTARGYPGRVSLSSSSIVGLAAAGYRVVDRPDTTLDLLGGARGFALSNTIEVAVAPHRLAYGKDRQWADAVVGARLTRMLTDRWSVTGMGFVGAGESRFEWDAFGGFGYRFGHGFTGFAGYRALSVDYHRGTFVYDALQYGPIVGMRISF
jgi:hypothetical protein